MKVAELLGEDQNGALLISSRLAIHHISWALPFTRATCYIAQPWAGVLERTQVRILGLDLSPYQISY